MSAFDSLASLLCIASEPVNAMADRALHRTKRLLAKHLPKVARPDIRATHIRLARSVRMGRGDGEPLRAHLLPRMCLSCSRQPAVHVNIMQETEVVSTSEMALTQELHIIRAHHLHYASLLEDFRKSVIFVRDTTHPALDALPQAEREANHEMLNRECASLLSEVERLETARKMHDMRLKNVMNLVFSSINILDSRRIQKMTEAAAQDSAGELLAIS